MAITVATGSFIAHPTGTSTAIHSFNSQPGFIPFSLQTWTADPTQQSNWIVTVPIYGVEPDPWTGTQTLTITYACTAVMDITVNFAITYSSDESVTWIQYGGE